MTDNNQLTALFNRMCQAWTDGDAVAYGVCFTDDSDYVSFDGSRAQGRAPMGDAHDKLFRGVLSAPSSARSSPSGTSATTWRCCTAPARYSPRGAHKHPGGA